MTDWASDSGFSIVTTRVIGWPSGRRRRARSPGSVNDQPTTSWRPRPARMSSARRFVRWAAVSRPAARSGGSVAGRRSTPSIRATSSIRSTSRVTSLRRHDGTVTASAPPPPPATPNPSDRRISAERSGPIGAPRRRRRWSGSRRMTAGGGPGPPTSIVPGTSRAPQSSTSSELAATSASAAASGSSPFSKRPDASLRSPSRAEVAWMFAPTQVAASSRTRAVSPPTSERAPPMIPAIEVGPSSSQMTTVSPSSRRSTPSRVRIASPSPARRTTSRRPATRSRSKAWSGCPVTSIT